MISISTAVRGMISRVMISRNDWIIILLMINRDGELGSNGMVDEDSKERHLGKHHCS